MPLPSSTPLSKLRLPALPTGELLQSHWPIVSFILPQVVPLFHTSSGLWFQVIFIFPFLISTISELNWGHNTEIIRFVRGLGGIIYEKVLVMAKYDSNAVKMCKNELPLSTPCLNFLCVIMRPNIYWVPTVYYNFLSTIQEYRYLLKE